MQKLSDEQLYTATANTAQGLAGLLLVAYPELREELKELQNIVTRSHARLVELSRSLKSVAHLDDAIAEHLKGDMAGALNELEAAHHMLLDLTSSKDGALGRQRRSRFQSLHQG